MLNDEITSLYKHYFVILVLAMLGMYSFAEFGTGMAGLDMSGKLETIKMGAKPIEKPTEDMMKNVQTLPVQFDIPEVMKSKGEEGEFIGLKCYYQYNTKPEQMVVYTLPVDQIITSTEGREECSYSHSTANAYVFKCFDKNSEGWKTAKKYVCQDANNKYIYKEKIADACADRKINEKCPAYNAAVNIFSDGQISGATSQVFGTKRGKRLRR